MTLSGQIIAQNEHAIHLSISVTIKGVYPFLLVLDVSSAKILTGHWCTQRLHPLHLSSAIIILPFAAIIASYNQCSAKYLRNLTLSPKN